MQYTTTRRGSGRLAALVLTALLATACKPGRDAPGGAPVELLPGGISPSIRTAFDSATAAYNAGDLPLALELFSEVVAEDSLLAAAWVGLSLVERAMGRLQGRDTVLERARILIEPPLRPRGRNANPAT